MKRDLNKDLKLIEKTTEGPFEVGVGVFPADVLNNDIVMVATPIVNEQTGKRIMFAATGLIQTQQNKIDAQFIAQSREGWPYAITRTLEAEEIIQELLKHIEATDYNDLWNDPLYCKAKSFLGEKSDG